jgi:hypothetical protein
MASRRPPKDCLFPFVKNVAPLNPAAAALHVRGDLSFTSRAVESAFRVRFQWAGAEISLTSRSLQL